MCGLHVCASAWKGFGLMQLWPLCPGADLLGACLMITSELQKHLSALFTKVDPHFPRARAAKGLLPLVKKVLIIMPTAVRYI